MSRSGSRPAARRIRTAVTSVPLPGEPTETRFPRRSATVATPVPSIVTRWLKLLYSGVSVRMGIGAPWNVAWPVKASYAVSARVKAMSARLAPISRMLSTDADVTSAVA